MIEQKIYHKIGELLWKIMPLEAIEISFIGSIYPESYSGGAEWKLENGSIVSFNLGERPYEIEDEIMILMRKLKEVTSQDWNQYIFSLSNNMDFNIKFAYIDEEDSWPNLYMKGISDLTKEEAEEYYIPEEIWEERVRLKQERMKQA
ncbi:hypothetical protein ACFSAV_08490 [Pasteurella oralis]|uniref:DUF600 family protein n=1 Tax=Pasteurella oralis TaxID=1071947 RepID=A0ABW4NVW2_9PAST